MSTTIQRGAGLRLSTGDGAHALRCLWQMACLAAGDTKEARAWAARNAQ